MNFVHPMHGVATGPKLTSSKSRPLCRASLAWFRLEPTPPLWRLRRRVPPRRLLPAAVSAGHVESRQSRHSESWQDLAARWRLRQVPEGRQVQAEPSRRVPVAPVQDVWWHWVNFQKWTVLSNWSGLIHTLELKEEALKDYEIIETGQERCRIAILRMDHKTGAARIKNKMYKLCIKVLKWSVWPKFAHRKSRWKVAGNFSNQQCSWT